MGIAEPPGRSDAVESVGFLGPRSFLPQGALAGSGSPLATRRVSGRRLMEFSCAPWRGLLCSGTASAACAVGEAAALLLPAWHRDDPSSCISVKRMPSSRAAPGCPQSLPSRHRHQEGPTQDGHRGGEAPMQTPARILLLALLLCQVSPSLRMVSASDAVVLHS